MTLAVELMQMSWWQRSRTRSLLTVRRVCMSVNRRVLNGINPRVLPVSAYVAAGEFRRRAVKTSHPLKSAPVKSIRL